MAMTTDAIAQILARMTTSAAKRLAAKIKAEQAKKNAAPRPGTRETIVRNR